MKNKKLTISELKQMVKKSIKENELKSYQIPYGNWIIEPEGTGQGAIVGIHYQANHKDIDCDVDGCFPPVLYGKDLKDIKKQIHHWVYDNYLEDDENYNPALRINEVKKVLKKINESLNKYYVMFDGTDFVVVDQYDYKDFIKNNPKKYHKVFFTTKSSDAAFDKAEELRKDI